MKHTIFRTMALIAGCATIGVSPAGANLLANPSFEAGGGSYDGWFTFGSGPQIAVAGDLDDIYREGIAAAKIFGEFTACPNFPQFDVGGFGQAFTGPTIGATYELSGWSFVSSADPIPGTNTCTGNRLVAKISFFNATSGGSEIAANEVVIGDWSTTFDQWNRFDVSTVAPPGALRVEALFLFLQPGCDTGAVFVDDVNFEILPAGPSLPNIAVNPSFDIDLGGWTSFGSAFHEAEVQEYRTPGGCAKLFTTGDPQFDSGLTQSFPATPGNVWRLDLYAMTTCFNSDEITGENDNFSLARIVFRDGNGTEIGAGEDMIIDATSPLGTYRQYAIFGEAPPGTESVDIFILFISPTSLGGAMFVDDVTFREIQPVTDTPEAALALGFSLAQNVPNPFNPTTRIEFALTQADVVDLGVYDVAGRRVATLVREALTPGSHTVQWNGMLSDGTAAASGIYRYVLTTSMGQTSRSMMLVK